MNYLVIIGNAKKIKLHTFVSYGIIEWLRIKITKVVAKINGECLANNNRAIN